MMGYTSHRDAGLLAQSNHKVITERLAASRISTAQVEPSVRHHNLVQITRTRT